VHQQRIHWEASDNIRLPAIGTINYLTGPNLVADPNGPFRLRQAYKTGDDSASPLLASNKRFAEDTNTLYRFSKGYGEIMCEGCHGSTHAVWPNGEPGANDNVAPEMLQGYMGTITECSTCHESGSLPRTTNGPHGLHNVNDSRWYGDGHGDHYENNTNNCKACHPRYCIFPDQTHCPKGILVHQCLEQPAAVLFQSGAFSPTICKCFSLEIVDACYWIFWLVPLGIVPVT